MVQEKFKCYDDVSLQAYLFETSKPKGVIQFVHGMQEYCRPYFEFAEYLNKNGYNVYMVDQRAHGKSCKKISEIGKADDDIFGKSVYDQLCITNMLKTRFDLPIVLMGHSYGSFVVQAYMAKNKHVSKYVLLGSGYMKQLKVWYGKHLIKVFSVLKNKEKYARYIEKKVFQNYNKKYHDTSWVTSDENQEKLLRQDRLIRIPFSTGFYESLLTNLLKIYDGKLDKSLSVVIFSGGDDPIGNYGKGVLRLYQFYKKAGLNAKLVLYSNARHSLLHEKIRKNVYKDILNFIANK